MKSMEEQITFTDNFVYQKTKYQRMIQTKYQRMYTAYEFSTDRTSTTNRSGSPLMYWFIPQKHFNTCHELVMASSWYYYNNVSRDTAHDCGRIDSLNADLQTMCRMSWTCVTRAVINKLYSAVPSCPVLACDIHTRIQFVKQVNNLQHLKLNKL